jgi:tRNA uridine 5-carbamoylmethylation protein Kti12
MVYHKSNEYIETICSVSDMLSSKATISDNIRLKTISQVIQNYTLQILKETNVNVEKLNKNEYINMVPFFEYVSFNKIEFFDFNKMQPQDIDVTSEADLERYVLSHIYYISQK